MQYISKYYQIFGYSKSENPKTGPYFGNNITNLMQFSPWNSENISEFYDADIILIPIVMQISISEYLGFKSLVFAHPWLQLQYSFLKYSTYNVKIYLRKMPYI